MKWNITPAEAQAIVDRKYGWYLNTPERGESKARIARRIRDDVASLRQSASPDLGREFGFPRQSDERCGYWAALADALESRLPSFE